VETDTTTSVRRPGGVTAAAVVAMIGSLLVFLFGVTMFASAFVEVPSQPANFRGVVIATGVLFIVLALVGLATSIALLKMRGWARTASLVFAVVLVVMGGFVLLVAAFMPIPVEPGAGTAVTTAIRPVVIVTFAIPVLIGAWWLVLFNRASTRDAFAAASPNADLAMPLSISLTAWVSIIGGVACLIPILMRMPSVVLGFVLTGWAAGTVYAFFGALSIYIGRGLLDLRERARLLCIGWYVVTVLHTGLVTFVPPLRERMRAAERAFIPGQEASAMDGDAMRILTFVFVAAIAVLVAAFLHRHRALFTRGSQES
jgi:hypothetical protein